MPGNARIGKVGGKKGFFHKNYLIGAGSFSPTMPCVFIAEVPHQLSATGEGTSNVAGTGIL